MIPLASVLVSAFSLNNPTAAPVIFPVCHDVRGQIEARVAAVRATVAGLRFIGAGSSAGDWSGPVQLDVLKRFNGELRITLRIEAPQGVVSARGNANAPAHPTLPDTREVAGDLEVHGESGAYHSLTGTISAQGIVDTRARTLSVDFTGQVCQAAQARLRAVDGNSTAARYQLESQLWGAF